MRSHRQQTKTSSQFNFTKQLSVLWKPTCQTSPYFSALFLKELGVNLLADDLGADVIFNSNAKPHLFKYKLHFLLFFHGAVCLNLRMQERTKVENSIWNRAVCQFCLSKIASWVHEIPAAPEEWMLPLWHLHSAPWYWPGSSLALHAQSLHRSMKTAFLKH